MPEREDQTIEDQERDDKKWTPVCRNCGLPIRESQQQQAKFGWTHFGNWEGVRCPGRITGAVPDVWAAYRAGREDEARSQDRDEEIRRLHQVLAVAANAQCGCLGSTISEFDQDTPGGSDG